MYRRDALADPVRSPHSGWFYLILAVAELETGICVRGAVQSRYPSAMLLMHDGQRSPAIPVQENGDRRLWFLCFGAWIFLQKVTKSIQFLLPELLVVGNPVRNLFERDWVKPIQALASHLALSH